MRAAGAPGRRAGRGGWRYPRGVGPLAGWMLRRWWAVGHRPDGLGFSSGWRWSAVRGGRPRACPWVTEGRSGSTTSPDRGLPGIEYPGSGSGRWAETGQRTLHRHRRCQEQARVGQRLAAQPPELGKVPRRQQGSFTDESITGWETIPHQQTSTRAAAITGRSPHPR